MWNHYNLHVICAAGGKLEEEGVYHIYFSDHDAATDVVIGKIVPSFLLMGWFVS